MSVETRAFIATLVAVTPDDRFEETLEVIRALRQCPAISSIVITPGDNPQPEMQKDDDTTIVRGLLPRYLNNAVAALRLSSLPAIAWWRGGDVAVLDDLATLVDRLVLDAMDPRASWREALRLVERTAISDMRWTRLTPLRNRAARLFDTGEVAPGIESDDPYTAKLFEAWLATRVPGYAAGQQRLPVPPRALSDLLVEELRVRARDVAFEQAVRTAVEAV